ncbi:MAG: hypothetical protein ACREPD_08060 [Stenotrophomonas sp.]|uniref:hypothetical protein n=1 Tax=Stenotrophomonas sp. TaxID=69392 RepID=UPI003D6D6263
MRTDAYTAEAICSSLGLPSFANDPVCTQAKRAVRILLTPSFHPEICLTFADGKLDVVSAREMIWHQVEPAPMLADRAKQTIPPELLTDLFEHLEAEETSSKNGWGMIDGMSAELLAFRDGVLVLSTGRRDCLRGDSSAWVKLAISLAWQSLSDPYCRNALAAAARYIDEHLPLDIEPARKPAVTTLVLGPAEDRAELLAAIATVGQALTLPASAVPSEVPGTGADSSGGLVQFRVEYISRPEPSPYVMVRQIGGGSFELGLKPALDGIPIARNVGQPRSLGPDGAPDLSVFAFYLVFRADLAALTLGQVVTLTG